MRISALALASAVMLSAAPALAIELDNGVLKCGDEATYFPRGDFWSVIRGTGGPQPIVYKIHAGGLDAINGDIENQAIAAAFNTWGAVTCAGGPPNIVLQRGADWPTRDTGDTIENNALVLDQVNNVVYFVIDRAAWDAAEVDDAIVAYTNNLASAAGPIVTADMQINAAYFQWRATAGGQTSGCAKPAAGAASTCYDVGNTVLHEVGHFIGLNHVSCTDAVMYPTSTPTSELRALSIHERTGICGLYPPRADQVDTQAEFGEACDFPDGHVFEECTTGLTCVLGPELPPNGGWGNCTKTCSTDADCPTAYVCISVEDVPGKFCAPGPHNTGSSVTETPAGFCQPCAASADCDNGVCIASADDDTGYCSTTCTGNFGCPTGSSCLATDGGVSVCWPDNPANCEVDDSARKLNEVCYNDDPDGNSSTADGYFQACGTSLICVGFRGSSCLPEVGACVYYCNATDQAYSGSRCPDPNQDCCYGVDDAGGCRKTPDAAHQEGGCFTVRKVGETCVTAENSICENNAKCIYAGNNAGGALCYGTCSATHACNPNETCFSTTDNCGEPINFCCDTAVYNRNGECLPYGMSTKRELGVECSSGSECQSGICYNFNGKSACSRRCNTTTGAGCPGNIDVNGDTKADGGFYCAKESSGEGWCWMKDGPAKFLGNGVEEEDDGGCAAVKADGVLLAALPGLLLMMMRRRRG